MFFEVFKGGQGEIVEKKSRFIATVFPISNENEAIDIIEQMKKKYWDARHNCYAYVCGVNNEVARFSDDGEPSQTAGKPMLDIILSENLKNILVVVTRYFGGILLGGGGLVRAYSHSAKIGVDSAKIITMAHCLDMAVECDYTFYGKLTDFLSREETVILDTEYTDNVKVIFRIKSENKDNINAKLTDLSNGKVFSTVISENFCEF